jgi:hypothetical protein
MSTFILAVQKMRSACENSSSPDVMMSYLRNIGCKFKLLSFGYCNFFVVMNKLSEFWDLFCVFFFRVPY